MTDSCLQEASTLSNRIDVASHCWCCGCRQTIGVEMVVRRLDTAPDGLAPYPRVSSQRWSCKDCEVQWQSPAIHVTQAHVAAGLVTV